MTTTCRRFHLHRRDTRHVTSLYYFGAFTAGYYFTAGLCGLAPPQSDTNRPPKVWESQVQTDSKVNLAGELKSQNTDRQAHMHGTSEAWRKRKEKKNWEDEQNWKTEQTAPVVWALYQETADRATVFVVVIGKKHWSSSCTPIPSQPRNPILWNWNRSRYFDWLFFSRCRLEHTCFFLSHVSAHICACLCVCRSGPLTNKAPSARQYFLRTRINFSPWG